MGGTNPPGEEGDLPEGLHPVVHSKVPPLLKVLPLSAWGTTGACHLGASWTHLTTGGGRLMSDCPRPKCS